MFEKKEKERNFTARDFVVCKHKLTRSEEAQEGTAAFIIGD